MSSQDTPAGAPQPPNPPKPADSSDSETSPLLANDSIEVDAPVEPEQPPEETWEDIPDDVKNAGADEIVTRARLIDNDIRVSWDASSDFE